MGRFPYPIPNGWFAVCWSDELRAGEVRALHYFERELVLFRTDSGAARVLDGYCVHLGAHLGHGGRVRGETIQCPFHGWRFDGEGLCAEIPYAKRIPPKARVRSFDVVERNGMVLVWHHAEAKPPFYEVPLLEEFGDPDWAPPQHFDFTIRTSVQEMAENDHDSAHFPFVHDGEYLEAQVSYAGLTRTVVSPSVWETPRGAIETRLERRNFGLGLTTVRTLGVPGVGLLFLSSVSPIDSDRVIARWAFTVTKNVADTLGAEFIEAMSNGVREDVSIWENKIYRAHPLLSDGDGPIMELRRWARQFYSESEPADPTHARGSRGGP